MTTPKDEKGAEPAPVGMFHRDFQKDGKSSGYLWWHDGLPDGTKLYATPPGELAREPSESSARDAARYRWLREHTVATGLSRWMQRHQFLDAAIDEEMDAALASLKGSSC
jgi:hypothetical protein